MNILNFTINAKLSFVLQMIIFFLFVVSICIVIPIAKRLIALLYNTLPEWTVILTLCLTPVIFMILFYPSYQLLKNTSYKDYSLTITYERQNNDTNNKIIVPEIVDKIVDNDFSKDTPAMNHTITLPISKEQYDRIRTALATDPLEIIK